MNYEKEIAIAVELARAAGAKIMDYYTTSFTVEFKGPGKSNPVTNADKAANAIIVEGLSRHFAQDAILAEESLDDLSRRENRRLWCIDPLDGTRDFIAKNGEFAVMIGLAVDGEARVGVVYQPTEDALFVGGLGYPAWLEHQGRRQELNVSSLSTAAEATLMVSRSHPSRTVETVAQKLGIGNKMPRGGVGLKVTRIAEASAELYCSLTTGTHEWDACAPEAILRAAGGMMTDVRGEPLRYNKEKSDTPFGLLASNGIFHPRWIAALKEVQK